MTSKVAKKIALSIVCDFRDYTCHEGSVIEVVVHMVVMKCSWRADLNGGPFAEDGPTICTYQSSVFPSHEPSKVDECLVAFYFDI